MFVVAPAYLPPFVTFVKVTPASVLSCHWKTDPVDVTLKVALPAIKPDWSWGCWLITTGVPAAVTFAFVPVYAVVKPVTLPSVA